MSVTTCVCTMFSQKLPLERRCKMFVKIALSNVPFLSFEAIEKEELRKQRLARSLSV